MRSSPPVASKATSASRTGRTSWTRRICTPCAARAMPRRPWRRAIRLLVADQLAQESLSRVADQQRAAELVEFVLQWRMSVSYVRAFCRSRCRDRDRFACAVNARGNECIAAAAQVVVDFADDVGVRRIDLASFAACPACASRTRPRRSRPPHRSSPDRPPDR